MAENRYQVPENGAEVTIANLNSISDNAGFADDRVLWELFRPTVGAATPDRFIIPYGKHGWAKESGINSTALVNGNDAEGSVRVMPFRAVLGPTVTTPQLSKLRDQRSGYCVGASSQFTLVPIAANASGNPRWTLVYAAVTPETGADTDDILVKDPDTLDVSEVTGSVITKKTTVAVATVDGTAGASPTRPSLPADAAGTYYIALAYIWVPNPFTTTSFVDCASIQEVAPVYPIHSATGAASLVPANQQHKVGGTVYTRQGTASNQSVQPGAYVPPTMIGQESIVILLQKAFTPYSHNDGDVIDDSRDWRFRYFKWTAMAQSISSSNGAFCSDRNFLTPSAPTGSAAFSTLLTGGGQSFRDDSGSIVAVGDGQGAAIWLNSGNSGGCISGSNDLMVYVRSTDGALVAKFTGSDMYNVIFWLEATGPYSNFGTV